MSEHQQRADENKEPSEPPKPTSYSPQDARSDLTPQREDMSQQQTSETVAIGGSPETRKSKKKSRSPKKKEDTISEQTSASKEIPRLDLEEQQETKVLTFPVAVVEDNQKEQQPTEKLVPDQVHTKELTIAVEEAPIVEKVSAVKITPALDEAPLVKKAPAVEKQPVVEEVSVVKKTPAAEKVPTVEKVSAVENAPAATKILGVEKAASPTKETHALSRHEDDATIKVPTGAAEAETIKKVERQPTEPSPTTSKTSLAEDTDFDEMIMILPEVVPETGIEAIEQTSDAQSPPKSDKSEAECAAEPTDAKDDLSINDQTHITKVSSEAHNEVVPDEESSSFLSAKESQSENEKQEPTAEDVLDQEKVALKDAEPVSSTTPVVKQHDQAELAALDTASETQDVNAAGAGQGAPKESEVSPAPPPAPVLKKGPARIESLSVFGKSKADAKKEKAAKKKEKKKAKNQKGAPASRATSVANTRTASSSGTASQTPSVPASRKPSVAGASHEPVVYHDHKADEPQPAKDTPRETLNSEPNTNLDKTVPLGVKKQEAMPGAPSSNGNTLSTNTSEIRQEKAALGKIKKNGGPSIKVAVPNIPFGSRTSSTKSSGDSTPTVIMKTLSYDNDTSPHGTHQHTSSIYVKTNLFSIGSDTQADKSASEVSPIVQHPTGKNKTEAGAVDNDSVSSCSTVKNQQVSPPLSPSPVTETFVTPLQTPSALTFDQQSAAKNKKAEKRREQRRRQREQAAAAQNEESPEDSHAFAEQMNQIAYLKAAKASPSRQSYYDQARHDRSPTTAKASPTKTEKVLTTIKELEAKSKAKRSIPAAGNNC